MEAVRLFYEDGKTRAEIAEALNLYGDERVKEWVKKYREEGEMAFCKPIGRPHKQAESEQAELERLRMENALLKNIIPNCERKRSRSAISGYLPPLNRIRSESHVCVLWCFAGCLL